MAKRLKTGIVALGLGILLGLNTSAIAKDAKEPEIKTVQEEQPSFAYSVIREYTKYTTEITQNDDKTIRLVLNYHTIALLGNKPVLYGDTIILIGKKQNQDSIKLEGIEQYNEEISKAYKKDEINPVVKSLAEKILTEKIQNNSEPDKLIYDILDAMNTETKEV